MSREEISKEQKLKLLYDFSYQNYIALVKNDKDMIKSYFNAINNYEKLHFYRIIFDDKTSLIESDAIRKFINESFHIENNYIYQLNPCKYQVVPQYIISECDKHIKKLEEEIHQAQ